MQYLRKPSESNVINYFPLEQNMEFIFNCGNDKTGQFSW